MSENAKLMLAVAAGSFGAPYLANALGVPDTPGPGIYEGFVAVVIIAAILILKGF